MKLLKSLFTITLLLLIVSCGKDESDSQPSGIKKNDNKNSTSIYPEASRMEMPKLKGGQSILLVHKTNDKYDPDGNLTGKTFILDKPDVNVLAIDNNCVYGRYDDGNDVNFAVFDMNGKMINNDLPEYEYSDDKFSLLGDKENTYYISSNNMIDYIGRSKNYAAYIGMEYSSDANELTIIDLESDDTIQIDLAAMFKAYYVCADIKDDSLCLVMTDTSKKISFGSGHSKEWDISSLELHKYDIYALTDLKSGKITNQHKTRKYERIIYADTQKAITYYRGNYITYSTDKWKEIKSQKAYEIKKDGSYFFDTCGDYVFVFDDDTGKLLNKISIE